MVLITSQFVTSFCERISAAQSTISMCFYSASAPLKQHRIGYKEIWRCLIAACDNGCRVRLMFDHHAGGEAFSKHVTKQIVGFRRAPFPVRFISNKKKLHAKFTIFDNEWLYVGSHNLTPSGVSANFETGVISRDPAMCSELQFFYDHFWDKAHVC